MSYREGYTVLERLFVWISHAGESELRASANLHEHHVRHSKLPLACVFFSLDGTTIFWHYKIRRLD